MVKITYYRKQHLITCIGHARGGPRGEDPICAAVSALVLTLAENVTQMAAAGQVTRPLLRLHEGACRVGCHPKGRLAPAVELAFDTVCSGFQLLEKLYPQNVKFVVEL